MRVYLDDLRPAPPGYTRASTVDEAIALLRQGNVTSLSLDYDLGDPRLGTGLDVLTWLEQQLERGRIKLPHLEAHSGSPVGRKRLETRIFALIERFGKPTL